MCFNCEVKTFLYRERRQLGFLREEIKLEFLGEYGNSTTLTVA